MKKPRKSSTKSEKASPLNRTTYVSPYSSPETLELMRSSEAREWLRRFDRKIGEIGYDAARSWWAGVVSDIASKRGQDVCDDLRRRMNEERAHVRKNTGAV
jgi:hypothetical protein